MPVRDHPRRGSRYSSEFDPQWSNVAGTVSDFGSGSVGSAYTVVPLHEVDWRPDIRATIRAYSQLKSGWDSYGGKPIDPRIIESATRLISGLNPEVFTVPSVAPSPSGGIELEWELTGRSLNFHITPTGDLEIFFEDSQMGQHEKRGVVSLPLPHEVQQYLVACVIWVHDLI